MLPYNCNRLLKSRASRNIESLRTMLGQFSEGGTVFHFLLLCETFLNEVIMSRCKIKGYNLVSRNRKYNSRETVAICICHYLSYIVRDDLAFNVHGEIRVNHCRSRMQECHKFAEPRTVMNKYRLIDMKQLLIT